MRSKPNIIFIMTDHQRADSLGMVQCERVVTPNLNKLMESSTNFTRAYTTCPLCVPARTALATGTYPTKNKMVYNDWEGKHSPSITPMHSQLKSLGYTIGYVGVDHIKLNPTMRDQGLDYFVSQEDYKIWAKEQGVKVEREAKDVVTVKEEIDGEYISKIYSSNRVTKWEYPIDTFKDYYFIDHALNFLDKQEDEPFALFTYLWAPHPPLKVPEPYASMYDPNKVKLPDNINVPAENEPSIRRKGVPAQLASNTSIEQWRKVWAAHLGLVTMADELIGKLIQKLEDSNQLDNTIIVFTSDHGESLGQHGLYQKMEMYEESIHVPLIIKTPQKTCKKIEMPVSHLDIVPTIYDLVGHKEEKIGMSLVDVMEGKMEDDERVVFAQYSGNPSYGTIRRAAISKKYKYVYDNAREHELYDLTKDPHEMRNVAGDKEYKDIVEKYYNICRSFHEQQDDFFKW